MLCLSIRCCLLPCQSINDCKVLLLLSCVELWLRCCSLFAPICLAGLPHTEALQRVLGVLDRTPAVDTHKVGVVYVQRGQVQHDAPTVVFGVVFGT